MFSATILLLVRKERRELLRGALHVSTIYESLSSGITTRFEDEG